MTLLLLRAPLSARFKLQMGVGLKQKYLWIAVATVAFWASSLDAIPINQNPAVAQKDLNEIAVLEQSTFDALEKQGSEKLFISLVDDITPEMIAETQKIDKMCGKVIEVQHVKTEFRGSRWAQKWYITIHEGCLLHWKIIYARERAVWQLRNINFNTDAHAL